MTVLVITKSQDPGADAVIAEIRQSGARAFRFDTDRFPTEIRLIIECDRDRARTSIHSTDESLDSSEISSVWHRRLSIGSLLPATMDKQLRNASELESKATFQGVIASLQCFVLDPVTNIRNAQNKQLQLQLARELGLKIPQTLITNDPDAVRRFYRHCEERIVTKMLSSFAVYENEQERVVFTNPVSAKDLEDLDGLRLCPMTFQERVEKALELRTVIVGEHSFTAAIDSQSYEKTRFDWRRNAVARLDAWKAFELPQSIEVKLKRMLDWFGLQYGAFDLILTPAGDHVFLEVNPVGEFLWLDKVAGLPIARAMADVLLGRGRRRLLHPSPALQL